MLFTLSLLFPLWPNCVYFSSLYLISLRRMFIPYNVLGILNERNYGFSSFQITTQFFYTEVFRIVLLTTKMINLMSTKLVKQYLWFNVKLYTLISTTDDSLCFYSLNRSLIKDDIFRVPTCIYSLHSPVTWWHVLFTQLDWQLSAQLSPKNV